jgi:hypothetical protein
MVNVLSSMLNINRYKLQGQGFAAVSLITYHLSLITRATFCRNIHDFIRNHLNRGTNINLVTHTKLRSPSFFANARLQHVGRCPGWPGVPKIKR